MNPGDIVEAIDIDRSVWRPAKLLNREKLEYTCQHCGGVESSYDGWYVEFTDGPTLPNGKRWVKTEYIRKA